MYRILSTGLLILQLTSVAGQSLFEDAGNGLSDNNFQLSGYVRGVVYIGQDNENNFADVKSAYGESALSINIPGDKFATGFAEIRFRKGYEFGNRINEIYLREAFIEFHFRKFDVKAGNQIIAWGRADGWNPTNIITPQNPTVRSPEPDDMYIGTFMINTNYHITNELSFKGVWIPVYKPSVLPIKLSSYPDNISFLKGNWPETNVKNGSYAFKIDLSMADAGGSISYFNGYQILPGIDLGNYEFSTEGIKVEFLPRAYREQRLGFDFSTTFGLYGLRAEAAWQIPFGEYKSEAYIPNPDIEYIVGLEKDIGKFNIIAQYIGIAVLNYEKTALPADPERMILYLLEKYNRLISMQKDKFSHMIFVRPSLFMLHNILHAELFSIYNFTTKEIMVGSKISYDLSDAAAICAGYNYYYGKGNTLYDMIDSIMNGFFVEMKVAF